jgi:hypothetical protein
MRGYNPVTTVNENLEIIAPLQNVGANLTLKIHSNQPNMPNVSVNNSGVYYYDSMIRSVSLTSSADLSGINFTITGLGTPIDGTSTVVGPNGSNPTQVLSVISETIAGPSPGAGEPVLGTTQTANIYARIDSITTNAPVPFPGVSVGFGSFGITAYIFLNLNVPGGFGQAFAIQGNPTPITEPEFVYAFWGSLTAPESINNLYGNLIPYPQPIPAWQFAGSFNNNNGYGSSVNDFNIFKIIWTNVNDTAGDGNGGLYVDFVQVGITQ